jgi:hypothetical protein
MQPFLHDELFGVNTSLSLELQMIGGIPVVIVDNIFKDMVSIREVILNTPVGNWKYDARGRNYIDYYDSRITFPPMQKELYKLTREIIHKTYQEDTELHDGLNVNWFKQINPKRSNYAFPHHDNVSTKQLFTCLIYLNNEDEVSGGTAFFRNKMTGNIDATKPEDIKFLKDYPQTHENGIDYWSPTEYWDVTGFIPMRPNRLIVFPAQYYHASYHPLDDFYYSPRLSLVYWMKELVSF